MEKIENTKTADSNEQYKIESYKEYAEYLKKPKDLEAMEEPKLVSF
jgi:hypothetical protein